ncbi:MAG: hypothetical protein WBY24_20450, partial [Candidatus Acidiferrales bacterium]
AKGNCNGRAQPSCDGICDEQRPYEEKTWRLPDCYGAHEASRRGIGRAIPARDRLASLRSG